MCKYEQKHALMYTLYEACFFFQMSLRSSFQFRNHPLYASLPHRHNRHESVCKIRCAPFLYRTFIITKCAIDEERHPSKNLQLLKRNTLNSFSIISN
ncbi:protein of unknown function [Enterobacter cancerogenus]|nr:protein of unknown function [Enterobacter cancerogenus]